VDFFDSLKAHPCAVDRCGLAQLQKIQALTVSPVSYALFIFIGNYTICNLFAR
jgi:hypothetical protein